MITNIKEFKLFLEGKRSNSQYKKEVALYKFFVINTTSKKVESGWQYKEDAKEALSDYDGDKNYKVVSELQLKKLGIENPKQKWMNESNNNQSIEARIMSFIIPEKKDWIEMGDNISIKYMGKNYYIKDIDKSFFNDNIGKTISFKYLPNVMYIEFPKILNTIKESTINDYVFSIYHVSDGITSPYGQEIDVDIDIAIKTLHYYTIVSSKYSQEALYDLLNNMKENSTIYIGDRWTEIKINKNIKK